MALPVVTFPQPPPTSNTLTSHQRQQLLRSTRKLTKLLGSAPYLVDYGSPSPAVYLDLSNKLVSRSPSLPRGSYDFHRSPSPASSISSASTTASRAYRKAHLPARSGTQDPSDSAFSKKRPPMLRLASPDDEFSQSIWASTELDAIPGSPPVAGNTDSAHHPLTPTSPSAPPTTPPLSRSYTLSVPRRRTVPSLFIDTSEPAFKVTSEAATRRLKMERIRKRLGECVPVEAVFPHERRDDESEDEDGDHAEAIAEKKPARVDVDVRSRWKSSPTVVAFDVIYECPDEHGDEGLANGLSLAPIAPKNPTSVSLGRSNAAFPRQWGKLVKKSRKGSCF